MEGLLNRAWRGQAVQHHMCGVTGGTDLLLQTGWYMMVHEASWQAVLKGTEKFCYRTGMCMLQCSCQTTYATCVPENHTLPIHALTGSIHNIQMCDVWSPYSGSH